jgi:glutamate racemase
MNPAADRPIGVFDSGLGGLTILKEIMALLPGESTVYFGDCGRTPYGSKSAETVIAFSRQNVRFLLEQKVKMIVIACNTASSFAFETISRETGVPVVEVITPGAEAAAQATSNGRVGVIATRGTVESGVYIRAIQSVAAPGTQIFQNACPLFVGLAEEGWWDHPVTRLAAAEYLQPLINSGIDTLMLGCTHYPLLSRVIADTVGTQVCLVNAGCKVAARVHQILDDQGLLASGQNNPSHDYFTSDSVRQFELLGSAFLGQPVTAVRRIDIERY